VGASLLAIAALHSTYVVAEPLLSRAGSLPQEVGVDFPDRCHRAAHACRPRVSRV